MGLIISNAVGGASRTAAPVVRGLTAPTDSSGGDGGSAVGTVVRGLLKPLEIIDTPRRAVISGLRELVDAVDSNPETQASFSDFREQAGDPTYGFGTAFADPTGNKWIDRAIGFAGDVALDPLTYLTLGAGKFAGMAGRAAAGTDLLKAATAVGRVDEARPLIRAVGQRGVTGLTRQQRELYDELIRYGRIGTGGEGSQIGQAGLRLNVPFTSRQSGAIPGTRRVAEAIGGNLAGVRQAAAGTRAGAAIRGRLAPEQLRPLYDNLATGGGNEDVLQQLAVASSRRGEEAARRAVEGQLLPQADEIAKEGKREGLSGQELTRRLENRASVNPEGADGRAATFLNENFALVEDAADGSRANYAPWMRTDEGRQLGRDVDDLGATIGVVDELAPEGIVLRREAFRPGQTLERNGVTYVLPEQVTVDVVNDAMRTLYPELGGANFLIDDGYELLNRWTRAAAAQRGIQAFADSLVQFGIASPREARTLALQFAEGARAGSVDSAARQAPEILAARQADLDAANAGVRSARAEVTERVGEQVARGEGAVQQLRTRSASAARAAEKRVADIEAEVARIDAQIARLQGRASGQVASQQERLGSRRARLLAERASIEADLDAATDELVLNILREGPPPSGGRDAQGRLTRFVAKSREDLMQDLARRRAPQRRIDRANARLAENEDRLLEVFLREGQVRPSQGLQDDIARLQGERVAVGSVPPQGSWRATQTASWDLRDKSVVAQEFDALPDDQVVVLYHGTTPENAESLIASGRVEPVVRGDLPTREEGVLYLAPTAADARRYGDSVVEVAVRKGDVRPSVEAGDVSAGRALLNSFDGAVIGRETTPVSVRVADDAELGLRESAERLAAQADARQAETDLIRSRDRDALLQNPRTGPAVRRQRAAEARATSVRKSVREAQQEGFLSDFDPATAELSLRQNLDAAAANFGPGARQFRGEAEALLDGTTRKNASAVEKRLAKLTEDARRPDALPEVVAAHRTLVDAYRIEAAIAAEGGQARNFAQFWDVGKRPSDPAARAAILDTLQQGWRDIERTGVVVPEQVYRMRQRLVALNDPKEWNGFLRVWEQYTRLFKAYVTASPRFHVRNAMSATFMNYSDGVTNAQMARGIRIWNKYAKQGLDSLDDTERRVIDAVLASGAGQYDTVELGVRAPRGTGWSRKVGRNVEGAVRAGPALATIEAGGSFDEALARVTRLHFNYSDMSSADRVARQVFPFWTFMSRNLPLQFTQIWSKPRSYQRFNAIIRNIRTDDEEQGVVPGYFTEGGGFRLPVNIPGVGQWARPDLGFSRLDEDVDRLSDPVRFLADANPLIKAAVENFAGKQLYKDIPLDDESFVPVEGWQKALIPLLLATGQAEQGPNGAVITPKTEYLLDQLAPQGGLLNRYAGEGSRNEGDRVRNLLSFTGLPAALSLGGYVRELTPDKQAGELYRRRIEQREALDRLRAIAQAS